MEFKTVGKSKSSYTAISSKDKGKDKKSLSNAQFQPFVMKKRGVYVEKKIQSTTDTQAFPEAKNKQIKKKPPPRPRPGQKRFLASVLTILSKSTTGTQYPDIEEDVRTKEKTKSKLQYKTTNDAELKTIQKGRKTKKTKFRSRVLTEEMLKSNQDQLIILQSKKEIAQTPSNFSARSKTGADSIKWSDMLSDKEPKTSTIRDILQNTIYSGVAEGMPKEVLESTSKKEKKLRINDDPVTLASEFAKKDDKKLYNFFVDLLETTISVYNVKTDFEQSEASKTVLEINDSVAKKLEFKFDSPSHENVKKSKCNRCHNTERDVYETRETIPIDIKLSEFKPLAPIKPKVKAKSVLYTAKKTRALPKSSSFEKDKKNIRRPKKKALLTILKEQLEKDTFTFEEPESLYDALKVMARNKRRCEKSIRFDNKTRNVKNAYDSECMFERRKVISFGSKKRNRTSKNALPITYSKHYSDKFEEQLDEKQYFPSYHSLEVYGYDYEEPVQPSEGKHERRVIFNYHSSVSDSESNLGEYNASINCPGSSTSSNFSILNR